MNVQAFIEKLGADKEIAEKLSKVTSPEGAYEVAKEAGLEASFEEFSAAMKKLNDAASDLNSADVDAIVGGATTTEIVSAVGSTIGAVGTVAGAIASAV